MPAEPVDSAEYGVGNGVHFAAETEGTKDRFGQSVPSAAGHGVGSVGAGNGGVDVSESFDFLVVGGPGTIPSNHSLLDHAAQRRVDGQTVRFDDDGIEGPAHSVPGQLRADRVDTESHR